MKNLVRHPLARTASAALGLLAAGTACAAPAAGADFALGSLVQFFADPENVRGVFGAAAGALASVIAARPFNRARPPAPPRPAAPPRGTDET